MILVIDSNLKFNCSGVKVDFFSNEGPVQATFGQLRHYVENIEESPLVFVDQRTEVTLDNIGATFNAALGTSYPTDEGESTCVVLDTNIDLRRDDTLAYGLTKSLLASIDTRGNNANSRANVILVVDILEKGSEVALSLLAHNSNLLAIASRRVGGVGATQTESGVYIFKGETGIDTESIESGVHALSLIEGTALEHIRSTTNREPREVMSISRIGKVGSDLFKLFTQYNLKCGGYRTVLEGILLHEGRYYVFGDLVRRVTTLRTSDVFVPSLHVTEDYLQRLGDMALRYSASHLDETNDLFIRVSTRQGSRSYDLSTRREEFRVEYYSDCYRRVAEYIGKSDIDSVKKGLEALGAL